MESQTVYRLAAWAVVFAFFGTILVKHYLAGRFLEAIARLAGLAFVMWLMVKGLRRITPRTLS